jgi:hypothetical protein
MTYPTLEALFYMFNASVLSKCCVDVCTDLSVTPRPRSVGLIVSIHLNNNRNPITTAQETNDVSIVKINQ